MTYCHNCQKDYHPMGIANHRAWHRRRGDLVTITLASGVYQYDYRENRSPEQENQS